MLGIAISNLIRKGTLYLAQWYAMILRFKTLCKTIIVGGIDQAILIVQYIKSQYVALKLNIEHLVAQFIIVARLTKIEFMIALLNLGVRGQQLVTTVRQILRRVYQALKRGP